MRGLVFSGGRCWERSCSACFWLGLPHHRSAWSCTGGRWAVADDLDPPGGPARRAAWAFITPIGASLCSLRDRPRSVRALGTRCANACDAAANDKMTDSHGFGHGKNGRDNARN